MSKEEFYPCLMNDDTGEISRRVAPAMSFTEAILYLKQHHSGAWQNGRAAAKSVSDPIFTSGASTTDPE